MKKKYICLFFLFLYSFSFSNPPIQPTFGLECPLCNTRNIDNKSTQCPECLYQELKETEKIETKFNFVPPLSTSTYTFSFVDPSHSTVAPSKETAQTPQRPAFSHIAESCDTFIPAALIKTAINHIASISFCEISPPVRALYLNQNGKQAIAINQNHPSLDTPQKFAAAIGHELVHAYDAGGVIGYNPLTQDPDIYKARDVDTLWREMRGHVKGYQIIPDPDNNSPKQIWHSLFERYPIKDSEIENDPSVTRSSWYNSLDFSTFFAGKDSLESPEFTATMRNIAKEKNKITEEWK